MTTESARPRALHVVFYGGLALATLDIINAAVFWNVYNGASPVVIVQAIAAGLLGKAAFSGGAATAALGLLLHYLLAFAMAFVYWAACRRFPALLRHPVAAGLGYGTLTWVAMNHVIVPLSRASPRRSSRPGSRTGCSRTWCWSACCWRSPPAGPRTAPDCLWLVAPGAYACNHQSSANFRGRNP